MARKPSLWFREQGRHFYTTVRGVQHKLSKDKPEAERLFHALLASLPDEPTTVPLWNRGRTRSS
jgi:hypothetical protein